MTALGLVHVMGRHEDRGAATDQHEQALPEIPAAPGIDGTRRLVEQQQLRAMQRRRGEREPLALSAAQRAGALRQQALELELGGELGDARVSRSAPDRPKIRAMNLRFSCTVRSSHSENRCVM